MQHAQFYLDGGSHRKLTKAKMVCVLEASIAAAGFEYREVLSADDCPPGFSIIIASDAMLLNEIMPPPLRLQRGSRTPIGPFVGSFCIGFIRGSSATSSFIRRSTRLMAAFSVALWTDRRPGDGWRSLPGCSIALHV